MIVRRSLLQYLVGTSCSFSRSLRSLRSLRSAGHMETSVAVLPFFAQGEIVKGFGRGSKELGFPTGKTTDLF